MMLSGCAGGFAALGCIASAGAIAAPPPLSGVFIAGSFPEMSIAMLLSERFRFCALASVAGCAGAASDAGDAPDFAAALEGARHLQEAGAKMLQKQRKMSAATDRMNAKLRETERALLIPEGLPNRPWFRHAIYAPGQYTGYAAVVIPGVNEAIDRGDLHRTEQQIAALAAALNRAVLVLEQYR